MADDWKTPNWLMDFFRFDFYDPCPTIFLEDGLKADWKSPTYCNPPYSNPEPWVDKAISESKKGVKVVMLLRVDCSTKWYRKLIENNAHIAYFNERLHFSESKNAPPFPVMLVFLNG